MWPLYSVTIMISPGRVDAHPGILARSTNGHQHARRLTMPSTDEGISGRPR